MFRADLISYIKFLDTFFDEPDDYEYWSYDATDLREEIMTLQHQIADEIKLMKESNDSHTQQQPEDDLQGVLFDEEEWETAAYMCSESRTSGLSAATIAEFDNYFSGHRIP